MSAAAAALAELGGDELETCEGCGRAVYDARQAALEVDGQRLASWTLCPSCTSQLVADAALWVDALDAATARTLELGSPRPARLGDVEASAVDAALAFRASRPLSPPGGGNRV